MVEYTGRIAFHATDSGGRLICKRRRTTANTATEPHGLAHQFKLCAGLNALGTHVECGNGWMELEEVDGLYYECL